MGGGFGGCTLNLIKRNGLEQFIKKVKTEYLNKFRIKVSIYPVNITDGTKITQL